MKTKIIREIKQSWRLIFPLGTILAMLLYAYAKGN